MASPAYSSSAAGRRSRASAAERRRIRARTRRRRLLAALVLIVTGGAGIVAASTLLPVQRAANELEYPLRHEDIIRQQARAKGVDPALVAAMIYAESRFVEGRTSSAGAIGLMQVTPETAQDIARRSGGTAFHVSDLSTPQWNIAYGTYHLRYLLDRYHGAVLPAVAAYNAGPGNVDRWLAQHGGSLTAAQIPFAETRAYVRKVLAAREQYARRYPAQLGT